jgi:hypothetical protein
MREGWRLAEASGANLLSEEEIDAEIDAVRTAQQLKKVG